MLCLKTSTFAQILCNLHSTCLIFKLTLGLWPLDMLFYIHFKLRFTNFRQITSILSVKKQAKGPKAPYFNGVWGCYPHLLQDHIQLKKKGIPIYPGIFTGNKPAAGLIGGMGARPPLNSRPSGLRYSWGPQGPQIMAEGHASLLLSGLERRLALYTRGPRH